MLQPVVNNYCRTIFIETDKYLETTRSTTRSKFDVIRALKQWHRRRDAYKIITGTMEKFLFWSLCKVAKYTPKSGKFGVILGCIYVTEATDICM